MNNNINSNKLIMNSSRIPRYRQSLLMTPHPAQQLSQQHPPITQRLPQLNNTGRSSSVKTQQTPTSARIPATHPPLTRSPSQPQIGTLSQNIIDIIVNRRKAGKDPMPIRHPPYNYTHLFNSCFYNATCLMLSTMSKISLKYCLLTSYILLPNVSVQDIRQRNLLLWSSANEAGINIKDTGNVVETFQKIYNILSLNPTEIYFYSLTNDNATDKDIGQVLAKVNYPQYLVVDIEAYNYFYKIQSPYVQHVKFNIVNNDPDNLAPVTTYTLNSIIIYNSGHYVFVQVQNGKYVLYDDLHPGLYEISFDMLFEHNFAEHHFLACYVRGDVNKNN